METRVAGALRRDGETLLETSQAAVRGWTHMIDSRLFPTA